MSSILVLLFNLLLILMDQAYPKVIKLGLAKTKSQHIIEKTFLIYTPKIIKFIYCADTSSIQHLPLSLQLKEPESIYSSTNKNNKSNNGFKTPKIKLVSRKTTQLEEKSDKNYRSPYCSSKSQKIVILSKTIKKNKQIPSSILKSDIKTEPNLNVGSCDFFGCIQHINKQEINLPSHILQKVQSRIITLSHSIQIEDQPRQIYPDVPVQAQKDQENLKEGNMSFSRRNKIFDPLRKTNFKRADSIQNNSIAHSISRSRRIFQRTQSQRKNYELKNSFIRRNKIFSHKKPKQHPQIQYIKKTCFEIMNQSQIPQFALNNWPKQQQINQYNHLKNKNQIFKQPSQRMHLKYSQNDL